jgi:membrane protein implicated in regulation of membrane protease activity
MKHSISYYILNWLDYDSSDNLWWLAVVKFICAYSLYLLFMAILAGIGLVVCYALGISYDWATMAVLSFVAVVAYATWKMRKIKSKRK